MLLVKTSSLGDVIHAMPALTDALRSVPDIRVDWVVEEAYKELVALHPGVERVVPVAIRRWRDHWFRAVASGEVAGFVRNLRQVQYDLVLDAQGLIKSSVVSLLAKGVRAGFDRRSARESVASLGYSRSLRVPGGIHAIERQRRLFAGLLGYTVSGEVDYGLPQSPRHDTARILLMHGTTWHSKSWPPACWRSLCRMIGEAGYEVLIPAGTAEEAERARKIADGTGATLLPEGSLGELIAAMAACSGVVTVDSGPGHLACALGVPAVGLYGATDPVLTGLSGTAQRMIVSDHLQCIPCLKRYCRYPIPSDSSKIHPPCFEQTTPERVWQALQSQIRDTGLRPA